MSLRAAASQRATDWADTTLESQLHTIKQMGPQTKVYWRTREISEIAESGETVHGISAVQAKFLKICLLAKFHEAAEDSDELPNPALQTAMGDLCRLVFDKMIDGEDVACDSKTLVPGIVLSARWKNPAHQGLGSKLDRLVLTKPGQPDLEFPVSQEGRSDAEIVEQMGLLYDHLSAFGAFRTKPTEAARIILADLKADGLA